MLCVAGIPPKVIRKMAEIRYAVGFRTNLQLVVLKILMVVFCDGDGFVALILLDGFFCGLGQGRLYGGECFMVLRMVPKLVREMAEIRYVVGFCTNFCKAGRFEDSDGGFL